MPKPIDFIPNEIITEVVFISLETVNTNLAVYSKSVYKRSLDPKWVKFCRKHRLNKKDLINPKWYDLYLRLCAEGML